MLNSSVVHFLLMKTKSPAVTGSIAEAAQGLLFESEAEEDTETVMLGGVLPDCVPRGGQMVRAGGTLR